MFRNQAETRACPRGVVVTTTQDLSFVLYESGLAHGFRTRREKSQSSSPIGEKLRQRWVM